DAAGDLVSVTDQYGQTARSFRYQHHLLTSHSRYGEIQAEYDYQGDQAGSRVSQQRQPDGTRYDYAYYPDRTEVTDQLGRKQVYTFAGEAGLQRLTALQRPDGSRWTYRHDQAGRRIGEIDPLGRARWTRQGGEGKVSGATTPDGQSLSLEWDKERPLLRAVRGPDQAEWRYDYDERGRLIAETDPLGAITRLDYEGSGPPDRPSRVAD
ncbi:RHS repeat protein, partial [Chitinimonas sp. DQS-5]|nr:RHS repeat protein [Parachitinimonas caeni]